METQLTINDYIAHSYNFHYMYNYVEIDISCHKHVYHVV